jgi:hypothetical protein
MSFEDGKDLATPSLDFKMNEDGSYQNRSDNGDFYFDKFNLGFDQYRARRKKEMKKKMRDNLNELNKPIETTPLYNQSIGQILINTKDSMFQILDDMLQNKFTLDTFTRNNRLFYIGLVFILIACFMYLYTLYIDDAHDFNGGTMVGVKRIQDLIDMGSKKKIFIIDN